MVRNKILLIITMIMLIMALPISALAGSDSGGGVTLYYPDNMTNCNPEFNITTTGVDSSWTVEWTLYQSESGNMVEIAYGSTMGDLNLSYTPAPLAAGTTQVYGLHVIVWKGEPRNPDTPYIKLNGQWRVDCDQPPGGGEGCTPGFWRQDQHFDSWVGYDPGDDYEVVFGVDASFDPHTLLDAVWLGEGGEYALARHAVAALLNAANPDVDYDYTEAEVIAMVQAAYASGDFETTKDMFEMANEQFCELD